MLIPHSELVSMTQVVSISLWFTSCVEPAEQSTNSNAFRKLRALPVKGSRVSLVCDLGTDLPVSLNF